MASTVKQEDKLTIAMFPWLAIGHIIPFLELAKLIAQMGHKVFFISTPRNIDRLPTLPPNLYALINFIKLPLPPVHNLPNDAESTTELPPEQVPILKKAYDLLREPMARFLKSSKPDWLLYDFIPYWIPEISRNIDVQTAFFFTAAASSLAFIGAEFPDYRKEPDDFMVPPRWIPFPSTLSLRKFEVSRIFNDLTGIDDDIPLVYRLVEALKGCSIVAARSCRETDQEWLHLLEDLLRKPVLPVGQLPRTLHPDDDETGEWKSIKLWLDGQQRGSVVYAAFGTEANMSQEELTELAMGLELSGFPFFLVVRTREGSGDMGLVRLPDGLEDRVKGRGMISTGWAPQVQILAHDSVGVFLTHTGWNSVVEALQFSRPLVMLACSNEQGLNVRILEERKIGYSVLRDDYSGFFTRDAVAEALKLVVEKEEGKVYREKAKEMSFVFGDRELQEKYVSEFLGYLKIHKCGA